MPIAVLAALAGFVVKKAELGGDAAELLLAGAVAIGLAPTLGDRASITLAASPTSCSRRTIARCAITIPAALACWSIARAVALPRVPGATWPAAFVPGREASLVFLVMTIGVLAIEATAAKRGAVPGLAGSITVLVAGAVAPYMPLAVAMLPVEKYPLRWAAVLAFAAAALAIALKDPGLYDHRHAERVRRTD